MPRATDTAGASAPYYYPQDRRSALKNFVLAEMMRGAGYAALFIVGVLALLYAVWGLGLLLPADSKNAPPPMPYSAVMAPADIAQV